MKGRGRGAAGKSTTLKELKFTIADLVAADERERPLRRMLKSSLTLLISSKEHLAFFSFPQLFSFSSLNSHPLSPPPPPLSDIHAF